MKEQIPSKTVRVIVFILGALLLLLLTFEAGRFIGFRQATFSVDWGENYLRGFRDPRSAVAPFMMGGDEINPHGTVGEIVSIALPQIMVKGNGTAESIIHLATSTIIRSLRSVASSSDFKIGDQVVVVGTPLQNGSILANFIRIIPSALGVPLRNGTSAPMLPLINNR